MEETQTRIIIVLSVCLILTVIAWTALDIAKKSDYCRALIYVSSEYEFRLRPRGVCQVKAPSGEWTIVQNVFLFEPTIESE